MATEKAITEKTKWHKLRRQLNKDNHAYSAQWETAIQILENRLENKYIQPIRRLMDQDNKNGQGFPIVALCCSLIETLASFRTGKIYNHSFQPDKDPNYQYSDSIFLFCEFLKSIAPFA